MSTAKTSSLPIPRERPHLRVSVWGAPGPQNLASARVTLNIPALLLDSTKGAPALPNRVRDFGQVPNGSHGTMSIRRRFL